MLWVVVSFIRQRKEKKTGAEDDRREIKKEARKQRKEQGRTSRSVLLT